MGKIRFSVLMSVYKNDTSKNVKVAIESLLNQTLLPNQIVIIIDGPISQNLKELLKQYKQNDLFDIIFRKKNLGLGPTLNEGLHYCKYNYVARMDADDESLPNRFEVQINFLAQHLDIDCVGCNIIEYDENLKNNISSRIVPQTSDEIAKFLKYRNPINHPTVIFKKEKVLNVNGYEDYPFFEDYYLWAKMIKDGCKFYNIQQYLYKFRGGPSMYKRRGGIKYVNKVIFFEKGLLKLDLISKTIFIKNIFKRSIVALVPNNFRNKLYQIFLRK